MKVLGLGKSNRYIYENLLIFANTGFMGFPVISALYGNFAIFPFSIINMPLNILVYSYGVYLIEKREKKDMSGNETKQEIYLDIKKKSKKREREGRNKKTKKYRKKKKRMKTDKQ